MKTIILTSGGTGGHIFPTIALSTELQNRGYKTVFITDKRAEKYIKDNDNIKNSFSEIHTINASSLSGNLFKKMNATKDIGVGYFQAKKIIKELKPEIIIGFGGYPSFPAMYAAYSLKKSNFKSKAGANLKILIHEQNSILGQVNTFLADKVDKIATSFRNTGLVIESNKNKQVFVGNPVRQSIKNMREFNYKIFNDNITFKIFIVGGSQGASILSDVVPEAIAELPQEIRSNIRIDQQCRKEDVEKVAEKYKELGISADVASFYGDIAVRIASAHLVISRCGASTVAEITVVGRPTIFVPYKYAKDDHQTKNALSFKEHVSFKEHNDSNKKSAELLNDFVISEDDFTSKNLKDKLINLFENSELLEKEAELNKQAGIVDADIKLADLIEEMLEGEQGIISKERATDKERSLDKEVDITSQSDKNDNKNIGDDSHTYVCQKDGLEKK